MSEPTGIPEGAIGRLLHDLSVGTLRAAGKKDTYDASVGLREIDLQYQFEISGTAASVPTFAEVTISFDYALFFAPGQRESSLQEPHFSFGSHTKPAVAVHATVVEWLQDEANGSVIGAVVAIGATGGGLAYTGKVHLTFQGYGSLIEEDQAVLANEG